MAALDGLRATLKGPQGLAIVGAGALVGFLAFRRRSTAAPAPEAVVDSGYAGEDGASYDVPGGAGNGGGGGVGGAGDPGSPVDVAPGVPTILGSPTVYPLNSTAPSPEPTTAPIAIASSSLPSDYQVGSPASWDIYNPYRPPVQDPLGGYTQLANQGGYFQNGSYLGYGPNALAQGLAAPTTIQLGNQTLTTDVLSKNMLEGATPEQLASPEWRATWDSIQRDSGFTAYTGAAQQTQLNSPEVQSYADSFAAQLAKDYPGWNQ